MWGVPAMVCILGVGLYLSLRTRFLQIRKFPLAIRSTLGRMFQKKTAQDGAMTPFQAVCTALAATVGTGNIAGVAGAIAIGGPGAVFWMWISALLGMCTKFAEVTLAVHFRERNAQGDYVGGPMYYIKNGLSRRWYWLAVLYSVFGVFTVFGTGNATQVNTITASINTALSSYGLLPADAVTLCRWIIGVAIALILMLVLLGGIKRIGRVTERLVPFMALLYVVLALGVVVLNAGRIPAVLGAIVTGAFSPMAVTGGIVGSFFTSMQKGVARGIFSNEAGLGTGSIAHACADTQEPVRQGLFGIFEVFADTIVICTLTALVILLSGVPVSYGQAAGAELTISGFVATYGHHLYRCGHVLLRLFHHHRLGALRRALRGISVLLAGYRTVHGGLLPGGHSRRNSGPGPFMEHRGDLQRPDVHSQPDRAVSAIRHAAAPRARRAGWEPCAQGPGMRFLGLLFP